MDETITKHERDLQAIAKFRMFDDTFMSAVFDGQKAETELLLKVVLGRDDIRVVSSKAQYYLANPYGREVRLDIFAEDTDGRVYNVEVQRELKGASVKRARFNSAIVDVSLLRKGQPHDDIPDRYTIFITEEDKFGRGVPAYHGQMKIDELDNAPVGDGGFLIYVNGAYRNLETPIGKLMHDFFCDKAEDIIDPLLRERVRYLKETEGGRKKMCEIMENRITEEKIDLAKEAVREGELSLNQIAKVLHLPLAVVEALAKPQYA